MAHYFLDQTQRSRGTNVGPDSDNWRVTCGPIGPPQPQQLRRSEVTNLPVIHQRGAPPPAPTLSMPRRKKNSEYFQPSKYTHEEVSKSLIVNYLPTEFTDRDLFQLFVPFGPLHSVKVMKEPLNGNSCGFGFVNFIKSAQATHAKSSLNGYHIAGKRLKVAFARPPTDDMRETKLFITNLPPRCTEADLSHIFGKYGHIIQVNLVYDKLTGRSLRRGFVRYAHRDQAYGALLGLTHYLFPDSKEPIKVRLATDNSQTYVEPLPFINPAPTGSSSYKWAK